MMGEHKGVWRSRHAIEQAKHDIYTLWLFTCNDLISTIVPFVAFASLHRWADLVVESPCSILKDWILNLPLVVASVWLHLLAFNVENQRKPQSIIEDTVNKPWRPLPSGRITEQHAKHLGFLANVGALLFSCLFGGYRQSALLMLTEYFYNDLGGDNFILKNILNGLGMMCFPAAALEVASHEPLRPEIMPWLFLIVTVTSTTVHVQDLRDVPGDAAAGRCTIPMVVGDNVARISIIVWMLIWSVLCPIYWKIPMVSLGSLLPIGITFLAGFRILWKRSVRDDKIAFKVWSAWIMSLYCLRVNHAFRFLQ